MVTVTTFDNDDCPPIGRSLAQSMLGMRSTPAELELELLSEVSLGTVDREAEVLADAELALLLWLMSKPPSAASIELVEERAEARQAPAGSSCKTSGMVSRLDLARKPKGPAKAEMRVGNIEAEPRLMER